MSANNESLEEPGYSPDALAQRRQDLLEVLSNTHPELICDNQLNVDKLQALLSPEQLAHPSEHYELLWAGKADARRDVQKTTSHTLLPSADNPVQAPHILIEGENLEVLRVLQRSYYGKVKMIYIDPPYNTGNDSFIYPDDYSETLDEYLKRTGEKSEAGYLNKQSLWKKNSKESGRYHSAWLSMMYPRLFLARNLLRDDGVIFISIDDNEAANLKLLCDEVFGAANFVGNIGWESKTKSQNTKTAFNKLQPKIEYVWLYKKNSCNRFNLRVIGQKIYEEEDSEGSFRYHKIELMDAEGGRGRESMVFPIMGINPPIGKQWKLGKESVDEFVARGDLLIVDGSPTIKMREDDERSDVTEPFWGFCAKDIGTAESAKIELTKILEKHGFETVKPIELIKKFVFHSTNTDSVILDFFAGSGTTAHAVMALNAEDGGNRRCISVQLPEVLEESSVAYKAGYRTIADITRTRIDKVIAKLKTENPDTTQSLGCAYFTLAPSNFKTWRNNVNTTDALREQLSIFKEAEKVDKNRTANPHVAMLTELLLKHGLGLLGVDITCEQLKLGDATVHRVLLTENRQMWFCFDAYQPSLKAAITKQRPIQVVMLNSSFVGKRSDELLANLKLELQALDIALLLI